MRNTITEAPTHDANGLQAVGTGKRVYCLWQSNYSIDQHGNLEYNLWVLTWMEYFVQGNFQYSVQLLLGIIPSEMS